MQQDPRIEIRKLTAPLEDTGLLTLLRHKGSPWIEEIRNRIEGKYAESVDRFLVALAGDRLVAHVWYTVSAADARLGLLGHVFTRPDYRRRGISTRLMQAAMADFLDRGGVMMQLFTSTPHTVPFYEKLGYENLCGSQVLHETDWSMRYPVDSQAVLKQWFAPSRCRLRRITSGDLPPYCLLYNLEFRSRLKDWAQGVGSGLEAEFTFLRSWGKISRGEGVCCVLENGETIVGIGSLIRNDFAHQSHLAAIDCYVHPAFASKTRELIDACLGCREELGVEIVYAMGVDEGKRRTFHGLGFQPLAVLPGHYRIEDQDFDCELYRV